ncbi:MAG: hypothetical protein Q9227_004587 [Pyrenula ochraceoflavens]
MSSTCASSAAGSEPSTPTSSIFDPSETAKSTHRGPRISATTINALIAVKSSPTSMWYPPLSMLISTCEHLTTADGHLEDLFEMVMKTLSEFAPDFRSPFMLNHRLLTLYLRIMLDTLGICNRTIGVVLEKEIQAVRGNYEYTFKTESNHRLLTSIVSLFCSAEEFKDLIDGLLVTSRRTELVSDLGYQHPTELERTLNDLMRQVASAAARFEKVAMVHKEVFHTQALLTKDEGKALEGTV